MFTYASKVEVDRPVSEVFDAINDIARWSEWTDMSDIRHDGSVPVHVGSTGTFTLPGSPFKGPIRYELTGFEQDRSVTYAIEHPTFAWMAQMTVEPNGSGSRLASHGEFRLHGWRRLLQPIIGREVARGEATELVRLKAILEKAPAAVMPVAREI